MLLKDWHQLGELCGIDGREQVMKMMQPKCWHVEQIRPLVVSLRHVAALDVRLHLEQTPITRVEHVTLVPTLICEMRAGQIVAPQE